MNVILYRYNSKPDYSDGFFQLDHKFECYSLEDESRSIKVRGETRIPNDIKGTISLRTAGSMHEKYLKKFGKEFHKGMLCISNAANWILKNDTMSFQYIYIHIGNDDDDTDGCILTGNKAIADKNWIEDSTTAYKKLYSKIVQKLELGETVYFEVIDIETNGAS